MPLGSFSACAWKGVTPVPGGSPALPPSVFVAPKPPPKPVEVLVPPPNNEEPVLLVVVPKAGFAAVFPPNRPPPVVLAAAPKPEAVLVLVLDPNPPPNPDVVAVFVVEAPKRPVPLAAGVEPKAGLLPKAPPVAFDPKPIRTVSKPNVAKRRIAAVLEHR